MNSLQRKFAVTAVIFYGLAVFPLSPQTPGVRLSPHDQTTESFGGHRIYIIYGRPYVKGRKIFGHGIPFGQMWRTGADEATVLSTDATLTIGEITVLPGDYSLFTIPNKKNWTLVLNRESKLNGRAGYNRKKDLGRAEMSVTAPPQLVEQLTITIVKTSEASGALTIAWENTIASIPISVK